MPSALSFLSHPWLFLHWSLRHIDCDDLCPPTLSFSTSAWSIVSFATSSLTIQVYDIYLDYFTYKSPDSDWSGKDSPCSKAFICAVWCGSEWLYICASYIGDFWWYIVNIIYYVYMISSSWSLWVWVETIRHIMWINCSAQIIILLLGNPIFVPFSPLPPCTSLPQTSHILTTFHQCSKRKQIHRKTLI